MPTPDLTAARHDILIAINPELQLFPGELPDVDATDECWPVIEAVNRYCLTRGWEISYEHFPTIDGDYVVDVEIRQPLPEVDLDCQLTTLRILRNSTYACLPSA